MALVLYGLKFGNRTGYVKTDEPYDKRLAEQDLYSLEQVPTQVNDVLRTVELVKVDLKSEVDLRLEDPKKRRYVSPTAYLHELFTELSYSSCARWRKYPDHYATLAVEIEYRIQCAQRFKVETRPKGKR